MKFESCTYTKESPTGFMPTLQKRVNDYFKKNELKRTGNWTLWVKLIVMLLLYFTPLFYIYFASITHWYLLFIAYGITGIAINGIGMGVAHDANHGAFSSNKKANYLIGNLLNFMGASAFLWKIQHNVLHHSFTNVSGMDEDLEAPKILRLSPHQKLKKIHRFQFLYIWLFYSLTSIWWIAIKDFIKVKKYKNLGLLGKNISLRKEVIELLIWKIIYFSYTLVLPLAIVDLPWWKIIIAYLFMHFIAGITQSIVFQLAHVMPSCEFPQPNKQDEMQQSWAAHQLATTSNFAPNSTILSWFIGGLNFQIEHHLFANISHVHYKKLSKIVAQTAKEFKLPYYSHGNFTTAVINHIKMLYQLGRV